MRDHGDGHDPADRDLIDTIPHVGRATTQFERSFGPSCLLSLIIVLLTLIIIKRFMQVSWVVLGVLALIVWFAVLTLLVRWRPDRVVDED